MTANQENWKLTSFNEPFEHWILDGIFEDEFLSKVKEESVKEISFSLKETDIYKIQQTGDLSSLSFIDSSLLKNIRILRDSIYSHQFRSFLQNVTGCGPLSPTKQDMSINSYTKGCHLLNHDDAIGTRRLSYILYIPSKLWNEHWGGALELYPTTQPIPESSILPTWNQFLFFQVQPGRSFHSVQEVVVEKERLTISGWFHAPQQGEEGYIPPQSSTQVTSSRDQLTSTSTILNPYPSINHPPLPTNPLSKEHISFLSQFLNPIYLQPPTLKALAARFVKESNLELHSFLLDSLASNLAPSLRDLDQKHSLGPSRNGLLPSHHAGTNNTNWAIKGPPHKFRYCSLQPTPHQQPTPSDEIIHSLKDTLFTSEPFRAWIAIVSSVLPLGYAVEARRFRPGLDYTLATSEENESRLDVVLGLTPGNEQGWQSGEWGGWEVCFSIRKNNDK